MKTIRDTFIPKSSVTQVGSIEANPIMIDETDPLEEIEFKKRSYDNLLERPGAA